MKRLKRLDYWARNNFGLGIFDSNIGLMTTNDPPIIIEQLFDNTTQVVWAALTQHERMIRWFFEEIPGFRAEVGFKTRFNVKAPSRDFMHLWEVTEVIPQKRIVTNWKYEGFEGDSFVIMELDDQKGKTKLTLTTKIVEDFDGTIPEFNYESGVAGWTYFIKERLYTYLNA